MNYKRVFIENSYLHIIILSYERRHIFIKNVELLQKALKNAKKYFDFGIIAYSIMPDHIHLIINPSNINEYPRIITSIKYYFSRNYDVGVETPTYGYENKGEKGIFQRRYYEHTIVDEQELNTIIDYIHYNPVKHRLVDQVKDWEYSTFNEFVKNGYYDENWCDFSQLEGLDYE